MLAVELAADDTGYGSSASVQLVQELHGLGVFARPLGNVVYLMTSQVSSRQTAHKLLSALLEGLKRLARDRAEEKPASFVVI